mgnify:CR=1 FL=1
MGAKDIDAFASFRYTVYLEGKDECKEEKTEIERCDFIHVHEDVVKKVKEHIPAERELNDLAEFFKVFGDVTRLKLLSVLFHSEMCVCDLAKTLNMTQSAISHQLRILKQMKLVEKQKGRKDSILFSCRRAH